MGSVFSCKLNPCCGDRHDCTPPRQYYEQAQVEPPSSPKDSAIDLVFVDIKGELEHASAKWGNAFDGKNTANDWIAYITFYAGQAVTMPWNPETFRTMLVKVAGLCVSAIIKLDETGGNLPKRHYDTPTETRRHLK